MLVLQVAPQPVQVDRMRHHRVVDQHDAQALAVVEAQRTGVGELLAVETPGELLHVAGEVQFDVATGLAAVGILEQAAQHRIAQHLAAVVAQADARIVQPRRRRHGLHVHQRIAALGVGMGHHRGGGPVVHPRHVGVRHPLLRTVGHRHHVAGVRRGRGGTVTHGGVVHRAALSRAVVHRAVVHAAMVHAAVPHVGHGKDRARIQRGHRGTQSLAHGQRARHVAGAAQVLREDGEGVLPARLDDHVEGLGGGDAELVHAHRMHVLPVRGHDRHLQARDAHVEMRHR